MSDINEFWLIIASEYLEREPEATSLHVRQLGAALQRAAEQYMTGEVSESSSNPSPGEKR